VFSLQNKEKIMYTNDPANNPLDALRLELGDIDPEQPVLTDEAYQYFIDRYPNDFNQQWINAGMALLFSLSRLTRERAGQIEVYGSDAYRQFAEALKNKLTNPAYSNVKPMLHFGGINRNEKSENALNNDNVDQPFYRGQQNNSPDFYDKRTLDISTGQYLEPPNYPFVSE
jgi:hypothetical protein